MNLDGSEIREDKPDLNAEDENPWDSAPMVPNPPEGAEEEEQTFIPMPADPYPNEKPDEDAVPQTRQSRANTASRQVYRDDTRSMAVKIEELMTHNEDLEIELNEMKEKFALAEATLGSLKRQVESAELNAKDSADRAQHAEVEFQRVLLSTEEYHEARIEANINVPPESRFPPQTSAKTLKDSRQKAIASVAATDPTGNMLRKWEREGESADDKLRRLEARLANKGLLNIEKPGAEENKRVMQGRRASLASKLNPKSRQNRSDLAAKGVVKKKAVGMTNAQATIMKTKLNQKLKYRPNHNDLVKGGILRPGAKGRVYGSRGI